MLKTPSTGSIEAGFFMALSKSGELVEISQFDKISTEYGGDLHRFVEISTRYGGDLHRIVEISTRYGGDLA